MAVPRLKGKDAYVHWDGGVCQVIAYPSQKPICSSKHFRRATRKARNLGYSVTVLYAPLGAVPRDGIKIPCSGAYILPSARKPYSRC